ncbi:MAG: hypothetical protein IPI32_06870 [Austwickia sp.]|jgi:hypothetical protein|nr:hypothetical protein [Austwickia sp.]MBK8437223.1 hypothetical protein [Austwickia sp.]MBK9102457.1 hypothetical protein [Austwickia sp.]
MNQVNLDMYLAVGGCSGRTYQVRRINRSRFQGVWDVCAAGGARYGTFVTLPGARRWIRDN